MAWIGNKSRPISFLRNETLFTTVSTSMMSTEIYFDDGIRKFARRTTKVDEGDGGEERLIETSANRSYVLCSDVCCAIHVSSLLRSLYNAPRFDHSSFFNKFLGQRYNETYSSPNLRYYFYLINSLITVGTFILWLILTWFFCLNYIKTFFWRLRNLIIAQKTDV